ncbi:6176_t:CDS:2 [Rhizophagus irregularis]|nr:6176_t:CDS:2 [Rhizophagus irregularis]
MSSIEDKISLPLILIMKNTGDELIILAGASDKRVAEKAQSLKKLLKEGLDAV